MAEMLLTNNVFATIFAGSELPCMSIGHQLYVVLMATVLISRLLYLVDNGWVHCIGPVKGHARAFLTAASCAGGRAESEEVGQAPGRG